MKNKLSRLLALAAVGSTCWLCGGCDNSASQKIDRDAKVMDGMMDLMMKIPSKKNAPKDGDYRIVDNHDGTFNVQSFWSDPRWQDVGRANPTSLEKARELKAMLERPRQPTPVE